MVLFIDQSVSLGTDPLPSKPQPSNISVPQALKNLTSPLRQTKSPDNYYNVLHIFNNNTYTGFRTTYKHVSIPNYVI